MILTVRDEQIERVLARDNPEVDDGWLCDKGRFGYQMAESGQRIVEPLIRQGGELRPASWEQALEAAAVGLRQAGERTAAIVGGSSSNEEGYLAQRIVRRALGSPHVESRRRSSIDRRLAIELAQPELSASVSDLDAAESILVLGTDPLHSMPILDLRIRKVVRRNGTRLAVATDRPSALDGGAEETARYAPGFAPGFAAALAGAVDADGYEQAPGGLGEDAERIAGALKPGATVIVWGGSAGRALLDVAAKLDAKLLEVPDGANARGLREVGCLPDAGPGLSEAPAVATRPRFATPSRPATWRPRSWSTPTPSATSPEGLRGPRRSPRRSSSSRSSMFEDASTRHADVVFPAESYAEKEGTVTHPDGRLQRLRPGVPHPGEVRPTWQVLVELSALLGDETGIDSAPEALDAIASEVSFYAGITHEEIGGRGVRWQEREAASVLPAKTAPALGTKSRCMR